MTTDLVARAVAAAGGGAALAQALDVPKSTVSRWLHGATPRAASLERLAALAGARSPVADQHPLVRARTERGLSSTDLARLLPVVPSAVSHWETGRRRPGTSVVLRLAVLLERDPDEVAGWFGTVAQPEERVPASGLVQVRARRGWTQREVARLLGISHATVQRLETGERLATRRELEIGIRVLALDDLERQLVLQPRRVPTKAPASRAAALRESRGLSLSSAASAARTSRSRLAAMEEGRVPLDLAVARRLAAKYGLPLRTLARVFGAELPTGLEPAAWTELSVAEALQLLRSYSGVRWRDLRAATGRSESTLRRWHVGERVPGADALRLLEIAYGLDVGKLTSLAG